MCSLVRRTADAIGSITWQCCIGSITWQSCHVMGKWTAQDPAVPLLDLGGFPRGVQVMQRDEALLDVGARAHFLGTAQEHPDRAGADFLKEHLFLGVGVCIANGRDVLTQ